MKLPRPEKGFFKGLLILAIPMMLQNLVTFAVGFADNLMIGSLGENAISGIYLGNQLQSLLQTVVLGVDGAMLVLCAQYWGKRDTASIKHLFVVALRIALLLGLAFTIAAAVAPHQVLRLFTKDEAVIAEGVRYISYVRWSYLFFVISQLLTSAMRSVESVRIGMYASFVSLGTNVVLNYILIFGKLGAPQMGAAGAGLATLISRCFEMLVVLIYVFAIDKKLRLRPSDLLHTNSVLTRDFARHGAPVIAGQIVWGLNTTIQSAIIGSIGAAATSAVSIYSMCMQMLFVVMAAMGNAVGLTTGKLVGSGEVERVKTHARVVQLFFLCIGVGGCILLNLIKAPIISLYNITEQTQKLAYQFLTLFSFIFIGTCYQGFSLSSLVKAGGDTKFVFINDSIFVWGIVIPSALLARFVFDAPPWVVFLCLKSDEILKCPVAFIKINRFRWIKNLTREITEPAAVQTQA